MATKLGRMVIYVKGLRLIKSHVLLVTWSCEIMGQTKTIITSHDNHYISTTTVPMVTKLGRMPTRLERLPPTKLFNPLFKWLSEIT